MARRKTESNDPARHRVRSLSPGLAACTGVILPVAAFAAVEMAVVLRSAGVDSPYLARFAAVAALAQVTAAAIAGAIWELSQRGLPPERSLRNSAALGVGLSVGLSVLFLTANGLPPALPAGSLLAWQEGVLALSVGGVAGLLRRLRLTPPRAVPAALFEPGLLAMALLVSYHVLRRRLIPPASPRGVLLGASALAAAAVTANLAGRLPVWHLSFVPKLPAVATLALTLALAGPLLLPGTEAFPSLPARLPGSPRSPDILLIVLDTTRADFAPSDATPALARLASEGTIWTQAFSTSCWTLPAHGSLFTGLAPSEHGADWTSQRLANGVTTLAEHLSRAGWRTAAFSANPWIAPEFGFGGGFEVFVTGDATRRPWRPWLADVFPALARSVPASLSLEDKRGLSLSSEALRYLGRSDSRPAFIFLNLMEPHLPYSPPDRFLAAPLSSGWDRAELRRLDQDRLRDLQPGRERTPREIDGLTLLYKAEVAYADYLVGRLVDRLRESGRLDATLTVVTSDHGENLGQHPPLDHQLGLYDTLLRIPLILRYPPGVRPQGRSDDLVSLQDLPGVILRLAGVQRRAGPLFGEPPRDAVFFEYDRPSHILDLIRSRLQLDPAPWDRTLAGIRSRDAKWIRASNGRHEAYDLMMDPGERSNLATAGGVVPASVTALADRLDSVLTARAAGTSPGQPPLSEEARQRLRSLGYLR